jgi:hypothetical protein
MDFLHPRVVFEKVDDGCLNIEKQMKDWCEKFICKKVKTWKCPSILTNVIIKDYGELHIYGT